MKFALSVVLLLLAACPASSEGVDLTLQEDAAGPEVVRSVLSKIENANLSVGDLSRASELFIRQSAFVESFDGSNSTGDGGIWRVGRKLFRQTQSYNYTELFSDICHAFCIDWLTIDYSYLRIPLYSGLAVFIQLFHLQATNRMLPDAASDVDRANFWVNHFFGKVEIVSQWVIRVGQLRNIEGK